MRVILGDGASRKHGRGTWLLDADVPSLRRMGHSSVVRVSRKAAALVLLLAARRIDTSAPSALGWLDLAEVPYAQEWSGTRTSASLAAQVRREIKALHALCPGLVETPPGSRLKGPYRLTCVPRLDERSRQMLERYCAPGLAGDGAKTSEALYSWLEDTEPIWRSQYYFDKPGEALSSLPRVTPAALSEPLTVAMAALAAAKRLREIGAFSGARRTLGAAAAAARKEPQWPVRQYLEASCALSHAWLDYRTGDLEAAERRLSAVDATTANGSLLRLRGQMLNLRSLVRRSRRQFSRALQDLHEAARLFVVEGDLMHLFAVYHNLACLIATEAEESTDESLKNAMYRRALDYSERNETYCRRYGIGRNSVLNKLLQVSLQRHLGRSDSALRIATAAEQMALESQNIPDALRAHRHRLSILFMRGSASEARAVHEATVSTLDDDLLREKFRRCYIDELRRSTLAASHSSARVRSTSATSRPPGAKVRRR